MPTALVPFCTFSNNFSTTGVKIDQFDVPVCNIFKAKLHKDQLCYEADIDNFKQDFQNSELSVSFFIHYNEDRIISIANQKSHEEAPNVVVVDTIGTEIWCKLITKMENIIIKLKVQVPVNVKVKI